MRRFKRIMVVSDLLTVSRGAFNTAIEFAKSLGAELVPRACDRSDLSARARAVHSAR